MAIELSELSPQEAITALYVGYFDRAPDPAGLNYWVGELNGGMSLAAIAMSFAVQPEATDEYPYLAVPNVANATSFLQSVYLNLFNRDVEEDDEGLQYWANELMSNPEDLGQIILSIINGAQNEDREVVLNKIEVGVDFAAELSAAGIVTFDEDTNAQADQLAKSIFDGVTDDDDSVEAAMAQIDAFVTNPDSVGVPGEVFTLTDGIDNIQGTNGDDLIRGPIVDSLETVDVIRGGAGTDTLRATIDGSDAAPVMSGVENVFLTNNGGGFQLSGFGNQNTFGIDLEQVTGVQQLWATSGNGGANFGNGSGSDRFTVSNASLGTIFGVTGGSDDLNYRINLASDAGDAATLTVALDDNDDATVRYQVDGDSDDIENINVLALGDTDGDADEIDLSEFDDLDTITVTGSGDIDFNDDIDSDDLEMFDASAATGDVAADFSNVDVDDDDTEDDVEGITVMGGSGNDNFVGTDGDDLIVGGAGNDTIDGGDGLDIIGGGAGADVIDLGNDGNSDEVHFDGASGGDDITGFDVTGDDADVISFLDGGVIDFANSETTDDRGTADLDDADYVAFGSIGELLLAEGANTNPADLDQKVVNVTGNSTINEIGQLETQNSAEFYAVFTDGDDTMIYYDADWSDTEGRDLVATIDATGLTVDNFDVY